MQKELQDVAVNETTEPTPSEECSLCCLAKGRKARVLTVSGPNRCRLMELGFTSGAEVTIARKAAFGGPLEIELRSYRLSLRREEAEGIRVEVPASATPS